MNIKRAPRVGFGLQIVPKWRARVDIARMMAWHLSKRFSRVKLYPGYVLRNSVLVVWLNGDKFVLVVRKEKNSRNEARMWQILINPARFPEPGKHFPEEEQERYAQDLRVISNEVHAVLARATGITRLRWWFVGWDMKQPGVRKPADLPWRVDAPEFPTAEARDGQRNRDRAGPITQALHESSSCPPSGTD